MSERGIGELSAKIVGDIMEKRMLSNPATDSEFFTAFSLAQAEMQNASLNKINPAFKSKYADLSAIREATLPTLTKHGLSIYQTTAMPDNGGGQLLLVTRLAHKSGQFIESVYPIQISDRPQAMGSALTYARRYSWASICGVAAEEDDDANAAQEASGKSSGTTKRTRDQISQEANRKRQSVRDVEQDVFQIETLHALDRYQREVLTPDFMAGLGMKQYVVEEAVAKRRRELENAVEKQPAHEEVVADEVAAKRRDFLIERIQRTGNEDALLLLRDEDEEYRGVFQRLPKSMQTAVRKAGATKLEALRMAAMSPVQAG